MDDDFATPVVLRRSKRTRGDHFREEDVITPVSPNEHQLSYRLRESDKRIRLLEDQLKQRDETMLDVAIDKLAEEWRQGSRQYER